MTVGPAQADVRIRPRRAEDLPALAEALWAQQPSSRYPLRNPLPFPAEQFLHAHDAVAAWTAELDGRPVGHVCWTAPPHGDAAAELASRRCAETHDCTTTDLAWVSSLFVGLDARRYGVGRLLLQAVVDDVRRAGRHACLEVLPVHPAAMALYESVGFREVARTRPEWLRAAAGDDGPDVRVMTLLDPPADGA